MIEIDNAPWFVAADVCRALDINVRMSGGVNTSVATRKLHEGEKQNLSYKEAYRIGLQHIASRAYGITLVSENGLYALVMRSDKPEAKAFQDWVTGTVLPSIRKDGGYIMGEEKVAAMRHQRHYAAP